MSIKVEGLDKVTNALDKVANTETLHKGLVEATALVEASAKKNCPKGDTGVLRRSISTKVEATEGIVFTPIEYAPYVEYGTGLFAEKGGRQDVPWHYQDVKGNWHSTSGMPPQPYLRPALESNRAEIVKAIKEAIISD